MVDMNVYVDCMTDTNACTVYERCMYRYV